MVEVNPILKICMEKGFLLDREMLDIFSKLEEVNARELIDKLSIITTDERVITKAFFSKNFQQIKNILVNGENKTVVENFFFNLGYARTEMNLEANKIGEEGEDVEQEIKEEEEPKVKVLSSPAILPKKVTVPDFVNHFRMRYEQIKRILQERGLDNLTSIRKLGGSRENYSVIVSILDKKITKNKNLLFDVEDLTGVCKVLVNQNKEDLYNQAKDLLVDDTVAFKVMGNAEILFANEVIFPDAYLQEKKHSETEELIAFTSDLHLGSTMFLKDSFEKFLRWINLEEGDEKQKELAKKVKYLFIVGDSIDGVGVYPGQEKFLTIEDIRDQYTVLAKYLKSIRPDVQIILSPGQHDGVRVAEPQPLVEEEWAPDLYKIENLTLVTNPAFVQLKNGFKILLYHGAGFHGMVDEIEDIRMNYGHDSPARMVKEVLKRRHLSPMHGSNVYIPGEKEDPLMISEVPDILATGDWHTTEIGTYNNILTIAGSCWQSMTPFEEKVGHHPDPCKIPLFNTKTREVKIIDFSEDKEDGDEEKKLVEEEKTEEEK
jgi:DNA polymerase II small subunit